MYRKYIHITSMLRMKLRKHIIIQSFNNELLIPKAELYKKRINIISSLTYNRNTKEFPRLNNGLSSSLHRTSRIYYDGFYQPRRKIATKNTPVKYVSYDSISILVGICLVSVGAVIIYVLVNSDSEVPYFTAMEVQKHTDMHNGIWVTYKNKVYDITHYIEQHPGGDIVKKVAGLPLEPFWNALTFHMCPEIEEILKPMEIGNISQLENSYLLKQVSKTFNWDMSLEPERCKILKDTAYHPNIPFGAESISVRSFLTDNDIFFVRNHFNVPCVDINTYRLDICIDNNTKTQSLGVDYLKHQFKEHDIIATLQCAGNRKASMYNYKRLPGKEYKTSPRFIGTAKWTGVYLTDVLNDVGLNMKTAAEIGIKHIHFEGMDQDLFCENNYNVSIPVEIALDPKSEVMLAYKMNDKDLHPDHGYPLRLIIPGVVGARNVKWLHRITASPYESESVWQQVHYKIHTPSDSSPYDYRNQMPIFYMPITSAITHPENENKVNVKDGKISLEGYAYSGGGNAVLKVLVSVDNGMTWNEAEIVHSSGTKYKSWSWSLWYINIPVPENLNDDKEVTVMCQAVDSSYNVQPQKIENTWNAKGYISNSIHKVTLFLEY